MIIIPIFLDFIKILMSYLQKFRSPFVRITKLCYTNGMSTLFDQNRGEHIPLAERMRPKTLDDFVGQEHLVGPGRPIRAMIEQGTVPSMILWGPPGSGKTTLARIIANQLNHHFEEYSAVSAGIDDVRRVVKQAGDRIKLYGQQTILFIDEIHRFNKAQQDAFLPHVEKGTIILIGATTENPSFEINAPLISRSQCFVLNPLTDSDIFVIVRRVIQQEYTGVKFEKSGLDHIVRSANGDARTALNALELAIHLATHSKSKVITTIIAEQAVSQKVIYFDKKGEYHYDTISALIKSLRGSDPDAALYWLARMIKAGEDPMFIARRLVIFSSEDIDNADPLALVLATSCMQAVHMVGMPEAQLILAQTVTYLATAKKSIASMVGLQKAKQDIDELRLEPVPLHLRNAVTKLMESFDYGKDHIRYPWLTNQKRPQSNLPENLKNQKYYEPEKYTEK